MYAYTFNIFCTIDKLRRFDVALELRVSFLFFFFLFFFSFFFFLSLSELLSFESARLFDFLERIVGSRTCLPDSILSECGAAIHGVEQSAREQISGRLFHDRFRVSPTFLILPFLYFFL